LIPQITAQIEHRQHWAAVQAILTF